METAETVAAPKARYSIPKVESSPPIAGPIKNPIPNATPLIAKALLRSSF